MHKIPHFSYKLNKKNFYNNSYIHIIPSFGYTLVNRNKIDFNNNIKRDINSIFISISIGWNIKHMWIVIKRLPVWRHCYIRTLMAASGQRLETLTSY